MHNVNHPKKSNGRKNRGHEIAQNQNNIKRIDSTHYKVKSQSRNKEHDVIALESGWSCSCEDHYFKKTYCKHIHAVEISLSIRKEVEKKITINEIDVDCCKFCNSDNIIKKGIKKTKHGNFQQFKCKDCNKRFIQNFGFEKMRATPQAITASMNLYFNGESLRHVADSMKLFGVDTTHQTIHNWIKKYITLMEQYLESITPQVSEKWRTDELYLKIKGDRKYLYAMMDDETRYWIAKQVSDHKYTQDVRPMFKEAVDVADKKPSVLISDGAQNFHEAWKTEYKAKNFLHKKTQHIRHIHLKNDRNNNKMERLNGELRDREKVMRSLKKDDSPIISGMQIHHNFIRGHMGLDGKTPAEASGVKVEGANKWLTLIQNAKKGRSPNFTVENGSL